MKKIILGAFVLAAAICAAFVLSKKSAPHRARAADLVPAETIFFGQLLDLQRTGIPSEPRHAGERWPQTALAKIWAEPEIQAFLEKPRSKAPEMKLWQERIAQIAQVAPGEAFFAVTSIDGPQPKIIAGFSFSGKKADVATLLAQPHAEMKSTWPAGKSDLITYGGTEIETFSHENFTVAEAFHADWYFVSNDMDLLHATLDASTRDANPNSLGAQEIFKKATAPLPRDGDAIFFTQLGTLTERLTAMLSASGQATDPKQIAELKKIRAITWGTKIEAGQFRDTIFVLSPGTPMAVMPRNATALTAPETVLYYAAEIPPTMDLQQSATALAAFMPALQTMEAALAKNGLKWNDFGKAFGPEFGTIVDWPTEAAQPSALVALDVRDLAKAKGFADAYTGGLGGTAGWGRKEEDGVTIYQAPPAAGILTFTPTMALTDRFLVFGLSSDTVKQGLQRLKAGKAVIVQNSAYQAASKTVNPPNSSFGYMDLKALFERSYGTFRPFIAMSLALNPEAGRYLDVSKLPGTETISKHLGPSIYSQSVTPDGTLIESVGPMTFPQVFIGGFGGGIAAAFPAIQSAMANGLKLDPKLFNPNSAPPTGKPPVAKPPAGSPPVLQNSQPSSEPSPAPRTPAPPPTGNPAQ